MKNVINTAVCTVAAVGFTIASANAQQSSSAQRDYPNRTQTQEQGWLENSWLGQKAGDEGFTPHHLVPQESYGPYAARLPAEEKLELREYLEYEHREPCQNYRPAPAGLIKIDEGCDLSYRERRLMREAQIEPAAGEPMELRPVVQDYTVYFDFDRANIRPAERQTIAQVVDEIARFDPYEVTIAGHADRAGPADYNVALSQDRAQAVSQALTERGISNRVLEKEAYGESKAAVPTKDGVKLQENRRVEIQFRK